MALAFCVAAMSDAASIVIEAIPALIWTMWIIDGATVFALLIILGFHWQFMPALVAEAIPGLALFPSWMAAVIAIVAMSAVKPPTSGGPSR